MSMVRIALLGIVVLAGVSPVRASDASGGSHDVTDPPCLILVQGAGGEETYATNFAHQVTCWQETARLADAMTVVIGVEDPGPEADSDRDRLQRALAAHAADSPEPLWLVLIGHGTFDGTSARFNLRGPDVSAEELQAWLEPVRRPLIVINAASASAPFLHALSSTNRIVITSTRSGSEVNYARFGHYLARSLADPESDLDRDDQTSLLEAFLAASAQVREYYQAEGRLATEHALIDDNGDGQGTPADWFRGVRARKQADGDAAVDGARAHQVTLVPSPAEKLLSPIIRRRRDALERDVFTLREQRADMEESVYFARLEAILRELAELYQSAEPSTDGPQGE